MSKKKSNERHAYIIDYLRKYKFAEVTQLSKLLQVSEVTIRKDLIALEDEKYIVRNHGGATFNEQMFFEPSFIEKEDQLEAEKRAIAEQALTLISDGMIVALSTGTTIQHMVPGLYYKQHLKIVTNALNIAIPFMNSNQHEVFLSGGYIRSSTYGLIGEAALRSLEDIKCDLVFIGTNGICLERGILTPSMDEASVVNKLIHAGNKVVLLADHSKFEKSAFYRICSLEHIHMIITDQRTPQAIIKQLQQKGIQVIIAQEK